MRNEEEGEEEQFYESLDRIASSSCSCSTSNSDSDPDPFTKKTHSSLPHSHDHAFFKYDAWISDPPAPISERRISLLHHMGLASDSSFNRRSISSCHLSPLPCPSPPLPNSSSYISPSTAPIARSKSHGAATAADPDVVADAADERCIDAIDYFSCCSSSSSSSCSVSVYCSPIGFPDLTMNVNADVTCNCDCHIHSSVLEKNKNSGGAFPVGCREINNRSCRDADTVSPSMHPYEKHACRRLEGNRSDSANLNLNLCSTPTTIAEFEESAVNHNNIVVNMAAAAQVCTIKNLDNGKEFVVNEIRDDGMWNKLKEVATGRQLTMEEFEMCVGHSPIVQELMRRQNVDDGGRENLHSCADKGTGVGVSKSKKKSSWLKNLRNVASSVTMHKERSSDERDTGSEKGGRRSSSATDDSQDVSFHGPERVRVRQYGKSFKELSALFKSQELQAHNGSIWSIQFSCDGRLLASAGEDCVIHVWQVLELERKGDLLMEKPEDGNSNISLLANGSPEPTTLSSSIDNNHEKKRRGRPSISRKLWSLDHIVMPETVFALTDKPICSFRGHLDDVLDLSWSKSQHLLSSSMDKTVRLWHMSSKTCLKIFSHSDYVTCIQFNPVDDRYFISGSLDAKVRIWSIPDRQVVDWSDLHEMVTAACYTPDGQGAVVGSYKGSCLLYDTTDNKLQQKRQINLQNKRKKAHLKKITGFQFAPGSSSEVLITSADSRIRVIGGDDLVHKFKGFRNTNSQISASVSANGKYIISASEDSYVYVWKHDANSRPSRSKGVTVTGSYEHFLSQDVSVAIPWPGMDDTWGLQVSYSEEENELYNHLDKASVVNHPPTPVEEVNGNDCSGSLSCCNSSPTNGIISSATNGYLFDRISATWPEEKLNVATRTWSQNTSLDISNGVNHNVSAYGMVIVTAGLRGEIRTFQNFGLPFRI